MGGGSIFKIVSHSEQQTEAAGEVLGKRLVKGNTVAYFGGMGMGKTVLTRGIVKGLGSTSYVSSPTFAIVNVYTGADGVQIHHFDMYRVTSTEDLETTGFFEAQKAQAILLVEWSENIVNDLPEDAICICIDKGDKETDRTINVSTLEEYRGMLNK